MMHVVEEHRGAQRSAGHEVSQVVRWHLLATVLEHAIPVGVVGDHAAGPLVEGSPVDA